MYIIYMYLWAGVLAILGSQALLPPCSGVCDGSCDRSCDGVM